MLGLFRRRHRVPASVRPRLDRDERVVAWAGSSAPGADDDNGDGAVVVATNLGLWLPGRDRRLGWHEIHKVTWGGSRLSVIPAQRVGEGEGYTVMADERAVDVVLSDPDDLPAQVRDRVTRSVAYTHHYELPGGGVRVVGRRVPGVNGLTWNVRYDAGTDAEDPNIAAATAELVASASPTPP